jgi:hypothetical protein
MPIECDRYSRRTKWNFAMKRFLLILVRALRGSHRRCTGSHDLFGLITPEQDQLGRASLAGPAKPIRPMMGIKPAADRK